MLCMEGFQIETSINYKLCNVDYSRLNLVTMNLINNEEYDEFFKFIFRDDKNRRLHFMNLGKNIGTTFCKTFKKGKIEKFEKDQLFNRVMGYLVCLLCMTDAKYAPISKMLFTKKSKRSFENTLREPSEHFNIFSENQEIK